MIMEHNTKSCSYPTPSILKQLGCCCDSTLGQCYCHSFFTSAVVISWRAMD